MEGNNFDKICRTCKSESDERYSLYGVDQSSGPMNMKYSDMIMAFTSVQITIDDGMPGTICIKCIHQLNSAFDFKKQVETVDTSLRQLLKTPAQAIKQELVDCGSVDFFERITAENSIHSRACKDVGSIRNVTDADTLNFSVDLTAGWKPEFKKELESVMQVLQNESTLSSCDICSKHFTSPGSLKLHKKHHEELGPNLNKCKVCKKDYSCTSHLQRHMRLHFPSKMYTCKICTKSVNRLEHLKRHMITHLKNKPHVCRTCKRGFNKPDNLFAHEQKCKGQRPHICNICNRGFTRGDSLEVHLKTHEQAMDVKPMLESLDDIDRYIQIDEFKGTSEVVIESDDNEDEEEEETNVLIPQTTIEEDKDDNLFTLSDGEESPNMDDDDLELDDSDQFDSDDQTPVKTDPDRSKKRKLTSNMLNASKLTGDLPFPFNNDLNSSSDNEQLPSLLARKQLPCDQCDKVLKSALDFDIHKQRHAGSTFSCRVCNQVYNRGDHLRRHMQIHTNHKPFKCSDEHCNKSFTRKDHMLRHLKLHTEVKPYCCDVCIRQFSREEQLMRHKAIKHGIGERTTVEKKFPCELCNKAFTTEKYREIHMRAHLEREKTQYCKVCKTEYKSKEALLAHLKTANDCSRRFLCSECGQRFTKRDYLQVHMRRHRGEKPFKCSYCDKGFPRTTDLKAHEKCHTGEKTHLCVLCGKGFGRAYKLTLHMRTHTGEKPYPCTYCDAAFAQSNDLKAHIRRHTGERYHCDLCTEAFLMGYMLTQHKRTVHGVEVPPSERPQPRINPRCIKPEALLRMKKEDQESLMAGQVLGESEMPALPNSSLRHVVEPDVRHLLDSHANHNEDSSSMPGTVTSPARASHEAAAAAYAAAAAAVHQNFFPFGIPPMNLVNHQNYS